MILGITGGTGSGKTTALEIIRSLGGLVLDCDAVYHELLCRDKSLLDTIEARFPGCVKKGKLQREKLGQIVFSDKAALLDLNRITHGAVKKEVIRQLSTAPKLAAIDAIGLFEGGLSELCDVTIAITAPEDVRRERIMARDDVSEAVANMRIAAQPDVAVFAELCDFVLVNDGSAQQFRDKCLAFFHQVGIIEENRKGE